MMTTTQSLSPTIVGTTPRLEIRLLGQFELRIDGVPVQPKRPLRKADALLAYLLTSKLSKHERASLIDRFCTNVKNPSADFRGVLKRARNMVAEGDDTDENAFYQIVSAGGETALRLECSPAVWVDAHAFAQATDDATDIDALIARAQLYKGAFLQGYEDLDISGWMTTQANTYAEQFDALMRQLLDALYHAERLRDVVTYAEYWISKGSTPDEAYDRLIEAHSELGDRAKLIATYERCANDLQQIGLAPPKSMKAKVESLLQMMDDGAGLIRPVRAIKADEPPPPHTPTLPKPLPHPRTTFVGRIADVLRVRLKLGEGDSQLLTLLGMGGVGKTRLALFAAEIAAPTFEHGVCFVELATATSEEDFFIALADALNFAAYDKERLNVQVTSYLRERNLLILIDAFEHVVGQPWAAAQTLDDLLNQCPRITALVTSRERLHLQREHVLAVDVLDYPPDADAPLSEVEQFDAVKLFLTTAKRVRAAFALSDEKAGVARICKLVQGLPLAIDLAAVQVAEMAASEVADAIATNIDLLSRNEDNEDDGDPRHRSVRAAFDYSWMMLSDAQQRAFAQLSLFAASFSREAALHITQTHPRTLNELVSNALLRYDYKAGRYDLHDLLRQFGSAKLRELGDETLPVRMAQYYLGYAQAHTAAKNDTALAAEWGNFLAGMRAAHIAQQWQLVLDLAHTLRETWFSKARFGDARAGLAWACEAAQRLDQREAWSHLLVAQSEALFYQAQYTKGRTLLEDNAAVLGEANPNAQFLLAQISAELSEHDKAFALYENSRANYELANDVSGIAHTLHAEAWWRYARDQFDAARKLAERAYALRQQMVTTHNTDANKKAISQSLQLLATVLPEFKEFDAAVAYAEQAQQLCQELNDDHEMANALYCLGLTLRRANKLEPAQHFAKQSLALFRHVGDLKTAAHVQVQLSYIAEYQNEFEVALSYATQATHAYALLADKWWQVDGLRQESNCLFLLNKTDHAIAKWSAAVQLAHTIHHPLPNYPATDPTPFESFMLTQHGHTPVELWGEPVPVSN